MLPRGATCDAQVLLELVESFGGGDEVRLAPYGAETSSAHYRVRAPNARIQPMHAEHPTR